MTGGTSVGEAVIELSNALAKAGIEDSTREARLIVSSVFNIPMARLSLSLQDIRPAHDIQALYEIAQGRLERRPLSHVIGYRAFFKHEFIVGPDVLDPRPETETLVTAALSMPFCRVLDLGTGSGAILFSLLSERVKARGVGTDLSPDALRIAKANGDRLGLDGRYQLIQTNWFEKIAGAFDLIVSNPPYIAAVEMDELAPELAYEPRMALTDEADGLSAYRQIVAAAPHHLTPNGRLMVEIGWQQGQPVLEMFSQAGLVDGHILTDLDGRDRVVSGIWRG